MKFSIKDLVGKCDQIRSFLRIWLHILKKSIMENFIFCTVLGTSTERLCFSNFNDALNIKNSKQVFGKKK